MRSVEVWTLRLKACSWLGLALASLCALGCVEEAISGPSRPARSPASVHYPPTERSSALNPTGSGCSARELRQSPRRVLRGKSTYYANSLAGHRTANGERYDPRRLTAAHRSLPFGTRIRVTRTDRKDSPVVCAVINDRGPYSRKGYILDLSRRAAEQLQMISKGVVPVRIEVLSLGAKKK